VRDVSVDHSGNGGQYEFGVAGITDSAVAEGLRKVPLISICTWRQHQPLLAFGHRGIGGPSATVAVGIAL